MTALVVHLLFVGLLVGAQLFYTWLAVVNDRHARRTVAARREWVSDVLAVDDPSTLLAYNRAVAGLGQLRSWTLLCFLLAGIYTGGLAALVARLEATGWPFLARGLGLFVLVAVVVRALSVPFDAYKAFTVDATFGFNRLPPGRWARSTATNAALVLVSTAVSGGVVLATFAAFPERWWLAFWLLYAVGKLALQVVVPRFVAPRFTESEPLPAGDLRDDVEALLERAGLSYAAIHVLDASAATARTNAYLVGVGRGRRVVLYDTLVDRLDRRELLAVLAHELAHWRRRHVWKRLVGAIARVGVLLFVLSVLVSSPALYDAFGIPADAEYGALLLASFWTYPLVQLSAPLENRVAIAQEREADADAVELAGDGEALASALLALSGENLTNPFPHPLYAAFLHDHPPVPERVRQLEEAGSPGQGPVDA